MRHDPRLELDRLRKERENLIREVGRLQSRDAARSRAVEGLLIVEPDLPSLLAAIGEGLIVHDPAGHILFANHAAEEILGMNPEEIRKHVCPGAFWCSEGEDSTPAEDPVSIAFRTGEPLSGLGMAVKRPDGRTAHLFANVRPLVRHGERTPYAVVTTFFDVTEQRRSRTELMRLNRALRTVSACNQAVIHARAERELLEEICGIAVRQGGYVMAWVGFASEDEEKTIVPVARAGFESEYLLDCRFSWGSGAAAMGAVGTAVRENGSEVCRDFANNPRLLEWRDEALLRGYASVAAVPLRDETRDHPFGVLAVYSDEIDAFDRGELEVLEELGSDLAFGLMTLRSARKQRRLEEEFAMQARNLEAFFQGSITPFALLDRDFNFIRVNEAYARADGREAGEFPGRNHFDLYPSDARSIFERVVATKEPFRTYARPFAYAEHPERGTTYWDWSLVPVLDEGGEVSLLVFSLEDVTERVVTEQENAAMRSELERAHRLSSLGRIAAGTAHEFNNVLMGTRRSRRRFSVRSPIRRRSLRQHTSSNPYGAAGV
ncbi:MAG: PAS domain-containing protein [Thermoanaerobaculia bacterium]